MENGDKDGNNVCFRDNSESVMFGVPLRLLLFMLFSHHVRVVRRANVLTENIETLSEVITNKQTNKQKYNNNVI